MNQAGGHIEILPDPLALAGFKPGAEDRLALLVETFACQKTGRIERTLYINEPPQRANSAPALTPAAQLPLTRSPTCLCASRRAPG
jgi:hypothetical protein